MTLYHQLSRVQKQLQGGEPLLSVDDVPDCDESRRDRLLLENDGAQEVRRNLRSAVPTRRRLHKRNQSGVTVS